MGGHLGGCDRMVDPLIAALIHIKLGAERALVEFLFGALVDDRTLAAGKWFSVGVVLQKILADLGAYRFKEKTEMGQDRIVAQNGALGLRHVQQANRGDAAGQP